MAENLKGVIKNTPVLDLRHIKGLDELAGIISIEDVGIILAPEEFMSAIMLMPINNVGGVIPIPKGDELKVKMVVGQTQVGCEVFSNPDDIVILVGVIVVTLPLAEINCRIVATGQIYFPEPARSQISKAIIHQVGQVGYYKGDRVYTITSEESFGKEFFEILDGTVTFFNLGPITIEDDVTTELFRSKVSDMVIFGPVALPKHLKPVVQALATQKLGPIGVKDEQGDD